MTIRRYLPGMLAIALLAFVCAFARAGDDAVTPFVGAQTNGVIYVDVSSVDVTAIKTLQQKMIAQMPPDQAAQAQANQAQSDQQAAKMQQWLDGFKAAGGKDLYIVVQLSGFPFNPGAMIAPIAPGADGTKLAAFLTPATDPNAPQNPMQFKAAVVGSVVVCASSTMIDQLKTAQAQPRPDLSEALAAGNGLPIRVVFTPASIKQSPAYAMMTGMMMQQQQNRPAGSPPPAPPLSEPEWNNVTWVLVNGALPPNESGGLTMQCKDADSANAMAALITKKLADHMNDPAAKDMGADAAKVSAALQPKVDGSKVTISIDQSTMDTVFIPMMIKASAQSGMGPGAGGPPGGPPGGPGGNPPPPPPPGGGM